MLVDSHCHLDFPDFADDREAVLARAKSAGVGMMVTISTKVSEADKIIALAEAHDQLVCSVGIHPHEAGAMPQTSAEQLRIWQSTSCRHRRDGAGLFLRASARTRSRKISARILRPRVKAVCRLSCMPATPMKTPQIF